MLHRLLRTLRGAKSTSPAELQIFLVRHTAFVAQKTVVDYCRVKTGAREQQMFSDPDFQTALTHCRWQTFAGAAQDVTAMAEAWLRPHATGQEARLAAALGAISAYVLDSAEAPADERATLDAAREALPFHLEALQSAPPVSADRLKLRAEQPLLASLPVHPDQRIGETPAIRGALRFHIVSAQQEMERAFDASGLARQLIHD